MEHAARFQEELEEYRKTGGYNILIPTQTIQEISPFHKPVLEIVRVDADPEAGEVYEIVKGSGDFALKATALQKIGYAAGLIWNARGCHRTDDGTNPNIVSYRAEAAVRKEDGTYMLLNAEYMVDLGVIEEETRESYEKKSFLLAKENKWSEERRKEYVEKNVHRDMLQKRKFRLQLAQTGAMDRVIRKILGLKGTYKRSELEKPFVVPKIAFNPDISDPKIRDMMLRQGLDAANILFGPEGPERNLIEHVSSPGQDIVDVPAHGENKIPPAAESSTNLLIETREAQEAPVVPGAELPPSSSAASHIALLRQMMKLKGYDEKRLKKPLESFTDAETTKFWDYLTKLPDVQGQKEIPF